MIRTYISTALRWKEHQIPQAGVASPPSCCREATPGLALSPQGKPVPALRFQVQGTGSHVSRVAPSMLSSQSCLCSFFPSEKCNLGGPGFLVLPARSQAPEVLVYDLPRRCGHVPLAALSHPGQGVLSHILWNKTGAPCLRATHRGRSQVPKRASLEQGHMS